MMGDGAVQGEFSGHLSRGTAGFLSSNIFLWLPKIMGRSESGCLGERSSA